MTFKDKGFLLKFSFKSYAHANASAYVDGYVAHFAAFCLDARVYVGLVKTRFYTHFKFPCAKDVLHKDVLLFCEGIPIFYNKLS